MVIDFHKHPERVSDYSSYEGFQPASFRIQLVVPWPQARWLLFTLLHLRVRFLACIRD